MSSEEPIDELQEIQDIPDQGLDQGLDQAQGENENGEENGVKDLTENDEDAEQNSKDEQSEDIQNENTTPTQLTNEFNLNLFIQLGDFIRIVFNNIKIDGIVYYRSLEELHIKPIGESNRLYIFEYENDTEEERFKEKYNVTNVFIIEKREVESFVEQQGFMIDDKITTYKRDSSDVTLYQEEDTNYKIIDVNADDDFILVQEFINENGTITFGDKRRIEFNFIGIDLDEPFIIINEYAGKDNDNSSESNINGINQDVDENNDQDEDEDEYEVKVINIVKVTLPKVYVEAEEFEQSIPDYIQKIDALNDFITSLSIKEQNDPKEIRKLRILVETLFYLKQAIVQHDNENIYEKESIRTLAQLINTVTVPLGRPVLNVTKNIYIADKEGQVETTLPESPKAKSKASTKSKKEEKKDEEDEEEDEDEDEEDEEDENRVSEENKKGEISTKLFYPDLDEMITQKKNKDTLSKDYWSIKKSFLKNYLTPWSSKEEELQWSAVFDDDFFRVVVPEVDNGIFKRQLVGNLPASKKSKNKLPLLDLIPFGIERALSTTYRKGLKRKKEAFLNQENAPLVSYLLFPLKAAPYLGTTRCSHLAMDSGASQILHKTMRTLLKEFGSPIEGGTSNNIQLFDASGDTLGNIQLEDYIDGISIISLNIHDSFYVLQQYGINNIELSKPLYDVLIKHIIRYQNKFKNTVNELRDKLHVIYENEDTKPEPNYFIEKIAFMADTHVTDDIILKYEIDKYKKYNPSLIESDIGLLAYIFKKHSNYFQLIAGKNIEYSPIAQLEIQRSQFLEYKLNQLIVNKNEEPFSIPSPNSCKHVGLLVSIRKKFDDTERFKDLTKLFKKYQGDRDENWIKCNVCDKHLLCIHERLQIEGFLNPKEKSIIDKDIILKFAGGQFNGRYICRNCGQPIRDFEFDSSMEFDDDGRPKSGNAVLTDDSEEIVKKLTNLSVDLDTEYTGDTRTCHIIITQLSQFMKIELNDKQRDSILNKAVSYMQSDLRSEQSHNIKAQQDKQAGRNPMPYEV